jgi:hypothetical protein
VTLALDILWILFLVVLGVLCLVIITPLRVRISGGRDTGLGWVSGYGGVPLRILGVFVGLGETSSRYRVYVMGIPLCRGPLFSKERRDRKAKKARRPGKKTSARRPFTFEDTLYILRTPHVIVLLGRLFRLLNPRGQIVATVGFDDPASTGMLATAGGLVGSAVPGLKQRVQYDYTDAVLEGRFELGIVIWIPQLIVGAVWIALSREGRAFIAHLWGFRKLRSRRAAQG